MVCLDLFFVGWTSSTAASNVGPRGQVCARPLACSCTFFPLIGQPELDVDSTGGAEEEGGLIVPRT